MKSNIRNMILLFFTFIVITGCSSQFMDKSLKTKSFTVREEKIKKNKTLDLNPSDLTGTYNGISDMYSDSDSIVSGTVKSIGYFEENCILLRKINVLVDKSYKGSIIKNTLISVLENDGYVRLKSLYETAKKAYEENNGDKAKEDTYLSSVTYRSDIKDIRNDMLIRLNYIHKEDSKVGDKLLLFLADSSDDTYKDKKVKLALNKKLVYPKGAYAPLGLFMGKFTRIGDNYIRFNIYFTSILTGKENGIHKPQSITAEYSVKEMEDMLNNLK